MDKGAMVIKIFGILLLLISIWAAIGSIILSRKYILEYRAAKIEEKSQDLEEFLVSTFSEEGMAKFITTPGIKDVVYACLFSVFALLNTYSAYGLLRFSRKIRFLFIVICVAFLIFFLYIEFITHPLMFLIDRWMVRPFYGLVLLNIFGLILLMFPKVKEQFK